MATDSIVIVSAARTPIGGLLGDFANLAAWELGAVAIKAAVERAGVPGEAVDEVLFGNWRQPPTVACRCRWWSTTPIGLCGLPVTVLTRRFALPTLRKPC